MRIFTALSSPLHIHRRAWSRAVSVGLLLLAACGEPGADTASTTGESATETTGGAASSSSTGEPTTTGAPTTTGEPTTSDTAVTTADSTGTSGDSTDGTGDSTGGATGGSTGGTTGGTTGGVEPEGCPDLEPLLEPVERIYVAPDGDDAAMGTQDAPLATLAEAVKRFPGGGTIVVRGGEYPHQVLANAKGTIDHPLVIRAEDGETPIFDGVGQKQNFRGTLHLTGVENVSLVGLEVRNATGSNYAMAISANGPVKNLRIRGCHLHHINGPVARFTGDGIVFEANDIHDGVLVNSSNQPNGGWPTCIGTVPDQAKPMSPWAQNVVVRNNHIRDCWGEGIALFYGTKGVVEGNVIERSWNVGIYMDNASDVVVTRNFIHMVDGYAKNPGPGSPILVGMESYEMWGLAYQPTKHLTITNNVTYGRSGIAWFYQQNPSPNIYYDDITVAHNTFVADGAAIRLGAVEAGKPEPTNIVVRNNAIAEGAPSAAPAAFADAFHVGGNAWLNAALPAIAGQDDVSIEGVAVAEPMIAMDLQPLAAAVGSAAMGADVPIDHVCAPRSPTSPTRGAFEP